MQNDDRQCRCPVRPYYTPGSFGSGSSHETALVNQWQREHGDHAYAKARDALAGACQHAEGTMGSGEAVLDMVHDIFNLPRRVESGA